MACLEGPPSQGAPAGFLRLMLKPGRELLRCRWDLIAGYFYSEHGNATLVYVQGVRTPFEIWEMPEEVDRLMTQAGAAPPFHPAVAPVNGGRRQVGCRTA